MVTMCCAPLALHGILTQAQHSTDANPMQHEADKAIHLVDGAYHGVGEGARSGARYVHHVIRRHNLRYSRNDIMRLQSLCTTTQW